MKSITHFSGKKIGRASSFAATLLLLCSAGPLRAEDTKAEQDVTLKTLIAGLKRREEMLTQKAISGTGFSSSYVSEIYRRDQVAVGDPIAASSNAQVPDREAALIRFDIAKEQWDYEIQQLLWSDISRWFPSNPGRSTHNLRDLYLRTASDGKNIYYYGEILSRPQGYIEPITAPKVGLKQRFFYRWFGYGLGPRPFSAVLTFDPKTARLGSVEKTVLEGKEVYKVTYAVDWNDTISEGNAWIAPGAGYSVVRWETLNLDKKNRKTGSARVIEWSDFKNVGGLMTPQRCIEQEFGYAPGRTENETWQRSFDMTFTKLEVSDEFVPDLSKSFIRLGTILDGAGTLASHSGNFNAEQNAEFNEASRQPWQWAARFATSPLPALDKKFLKALTGDEVGLLAAKYKFSLK